MTPEQAEGVAEALSEAFREEIATKGDLAALSSDLKTEIKLSESRLEARVESVKVDMMKWLVPLMLGQTAVMAALVKLL